MKSKFLGEKEEINLRSFIQKTFPGYKFTAHNLLCIEKLEAIRQGKITRLILCMPPRYGKTELVTRLIALTMGEHPNWPIIYASYGERLAVRNSRRVQRIVNSREFSELFPGIGISPRNYSVIDWSLDKQEGSFLAAGVGTGITGSGFKLGILDDLIKGRKEANSPTVREGTWDWYENDFYTRMEEFGKEKAAIIHITTRWHKGDPAGRMIDSMAEDPNAEKWEVVKLPALAEREDPLGRPLGEALWSEKHSRERLEGMRASSSWMFSSLFQQNPRPEEGTVKREWFEIVNNCPSSLTKVRYWDTAATKPSNQRGDPDWTAGCLLGEKDGVVWIKDFRHFRETPLETERIMRATAGEDTPMVDIYVQLEPGSLSKFAAGHFSRSVFVGYPFHVDEVPRIGKFERAKPFFSAAENGNVKLVRGSWNRAF